MKRLFTYIQLTFGTLLFATGVDLILIPNNISDSGISGIAIMVNYLFHIPVWIPFIILNSIILLITAKTIGKKFLIRTIYANITSSLFLHILNQFKPVTHSELLTLLFGGLSIGIGVSLVIRNSAAIDGTEMVAMWINKKFHIPISTFLLIVNIFVFVGASFVFSLEKAMFSIATFFVVTKTIDYILDGLNKAKTIMIIANEPDIIGKLLIDELGISITYIQGYGGYTGEERKIIYCIVDRIIYPKLREIVLFCDPTAIIEASIVSETTGIDKLSFFQYLKNKKS